MQSYSKMIQKYSNMKCNRLIVPDYAMEKDGVACGDYVSLVGENNDGIIEFCFYVEGCELCNASANYLYEQYNDKPIDFVLNEITSRLKEIKDNKQILLDLFEVPKLVNRINCLSFPFEMLYALASELSIRIEETTKEIDTLQNLDCDACMVASNVSWKTNNQPQNEKKQENDTKNKEEKFEYSTEYKEKWGKVSKAYLSQDEVELLKKLVKDITPDDYQYLRKEKISQGVLGNMEKYNISVGENEIWKDIIYRIHRKSITKCEFERVYAYIKSKGLKIFKTKGANSSELYEGEGIRVHLDYDFIAINISDAFKLAKYLLNNGYKISSGLFSFKKIMINGKDTYSGHFHLEKVMNSRYKIIVDVNFPGFPMGRIDYFVPETKDGEIIPEDQLIITLCHAYKHKNVYIKDINDIYMMVKHKKLDFNMIGKKIKENNLDVFASILFGFIFANYDLKEEKKEQIQKELCIDEQYMYCYKKWPFDSQEVYQIKKTDLENRLKLGMDNERVYLQPLFVFDEKVGSIDEICVVLKKIYQDFDIYDESIIKLTDSMWTLYICEIGIFIDVYSVENGINRKVVKTEIGKILEVLGENEFHPIPYSTDYLANWFF